MKIEYKKLNSEDVKRLLETGYFGETERSFTYTSNCHNFYKALIANEEMTDDDIYLILQATTGVAFGGCRFLLDQLVDFIGYKGHLLELEESPAGNPSVFREMLNAPLDEYQSGWYLGMENNVSGEYFYCFDRTRHSGRPQLRLIYPR